MILLLLAPVGLALALLFVYWFGGRSLRKKEKDEHEEEGI